MEQIIPISELQSQAKKIVERVRNTRDSMIITQRGRPAALLVNYEDYEGMVATLEELSQPASSLWTLWRSCGSGPALASPARQTRRGYAAFCLFVASSKST